MKSYHADNVTVMRTFLWSFKDGRAKSLDHHLSNLLPPRLVLLSVCKKIGSPLTKSQSEDIFNPFLGKEVPMSAPRDSRCRYKECYNCKHRFDSITGDKPEYQCGLAIDGTIRVFECGGYRYYLPATKAQRREQHEKLTEYQASWRIRLNRGGLGKIFEFSWELSLQSF